MHRARGFFLTGPLSAAVLAMVTLAAQAVPMPSLYVVIVPGSDPLQAAQEAMRVELVRLIGVRAAASDPALAELIDNARQYVQLERTTTTGQIQVLFDEGALSAAIGATGRSLWDADRPLLLIQLPPQDPAAAEALRARLSAAADERGLPVTFVQTVVVTADGAPAVPAGTAPAGTTVPSAGPVAGTAPPAGPPGGAATPGAARSAPATPPLAAAPAPPMPPQPLNTRDVLDAALRAGASAALVAQALPDPGMLQWTLVSPTSSGQWTGGPELAIDNATDTLASAARTLAEAPVAQYDCRIAGVTDLASFVNVLAAVHASPGVGQVTVSDVDGDQLTLHLEARGSGAELEHVLASGRLQPTGPGTGGLLEYRYVAGP